MSEKVLSLVDDDSALSSAVTTLTQTDPVTLAKGISVVRIALGTLLVLVPRLLTQPVLRGSRAAPDAVTAWRAVGARDVALGLGALMAAKHDSAGMRGWLEAGALADSIDVLTLVRDHGLHPVPRIAGIVPAAATAGLSAFVARQLTE